MASKACRRSRKRCSRGPRCKPASSISFATAWTTRVIAIASSSPALRTIYTAPTVVAAWRRAWTQVIPFFAFPPAVRRVLYTTNALENVHRQLRKIIKTRGHFPNDDAATKLLWLVLHNISHDT